MSWIYLLIAGLFEMGFTTSLKLSVGFTKAIPTVFFGLCAILSFWCLNKAIEVIPLGIAYAVWTGIGAAGTVIIGMMFFDDHLNGWEIFFLCTLVFSIFGLKFFA
ncbi:MAG TPA: multidrug efflux SMR transporter [Parachlamydiaceae bacterium]|nr:multidrug efflux SMR transporter [Parachlamydiaceae bacterium]